MKNRHDFNIPKMEVTLKITGQLPTPGCEYALRSASGKLVMGMRDVSSPILWVFRIPYTDFPYSLVELQGQNVISILCRDAVTMQNLKLQTLPVTAVRSKVEYAGNPYSPGGRPGSKVGKSRLPLVVGISVALLVLVNVLVWLWFFNSKSEDNPVPIIMQDTTAVAASDTVIINPEPQDPKYTYLFIPVETLREGMTKSSYDHLSSQAFPPGTDSYYDATTKMNIIRIPEVTGLKPELGIHLEGYMEEDCGHLELKQTNMPGYNDLVNYLTSDNNRLLVRPADPNKQPSNELLQRIKTIDLDNLTYVPLDTTPPTEKVKRNTPQQRHER